MKRTHILIIIIIAVAIGAIMATINDASTYVGFAEANANPNTNYTVIGYLDQDEPMDYDARANRFEFGAVDKEGMRKKVVYRQPKPQDFERSEEITMKGYSTDSAFIAQEILMKCPSKYNETNGLEGYQTYD
ncbi:MAG: cytochrome c maturation protein CcmE [Owenweeksia sp.]